jgi:hypothetical protein
VSLFVFTGVASSVTVVPSRDVGVVTLLPPPPPVVVVVAVPAFVDFGAATDLLVVDLAVVLDVDDSVDNPISAFVALPRAYLCEKARCTCIKMRDTK